MSDREKAYLFTLIFVVFCFFVVCLTPRQVTVRTGEMNVLEPTVAALQATAQALVDAQARDEALFQTFAFGLDARFLPTVTPTRTPEPTRTVTLTRTPTKTATPGPTPTMNWSQCPTPIATLPIGK